MAESILLASYDLDTSRLKKSFDELNDVYFELNKQQKELKEQSKQVAKELDAISKDSTKSNEEKKREIEKLTASQKELFKAEQNLAVQIGTTKREINQTVSSLRTFQEAEIKTANLVEAGNKVLDRQIRTKNEARDANKALNNIANQLNPSIAEEAELLKKLNAKVDENTKFIKDNSSETAKQAMNIGNYQSALSSVDGVLAKFGVNAQEARTVVSGFASTIKDTTNSVVGVGGSLIQSTRNLIGFNSASQTATTTTQAQTIATQAQTTATTATTTATNAGTLSLKAFAIALLKTGVGIFVVALSTLVAYLSTTQKGIDAVTSVTRPLKAIFESLVGVVQVLGESVSEAFTNPKQALVELSEFLKNNIINRFKSFAVVLDGIKNADFKKVADGFLQFGTGVENATSKIQETAKNTAKFFAEATRKGVEMDRLQKEIERDTLKYNSAQKDVNKTIDEQRLISKDVSKSFAEREVAARKIIETTKTNAKAEADIIQKKIERLKIEQTLNDTSREGEQELIDLERQKADAIQKGVKSEIEGLEVIASARVQAQTKQKEIQQKATDEALSRSRQEIDFFVANQGFKKKSLEAEAKFVQELYEKELKDLKLQFDKKKISQIEFDTQKLNLQNKLFSDLSEITIENAQSELDEKIYLNNQILENDKFLSKDQLKIKKEALEKSLLEEQKFAKIKLANGKINQKEYNDEIAKIEADNKIKKEELELANKTAENDKKLIDLENEKIANGNNFLANFELETQRLDLLKAQELENAEKTGADKDLIEKKYDEIDSSRKKDLRQNQLKETATLFGNIAQLLGENSKAGKAAAIAQATINTYQGVSSAWMAPAVLPQPFDAISKVAASGIALASGLKAVKEITNTKEPAIRKFAQGVIGIRGVGDGTSDTIRADLSPGESVINAVSTSMFPKELSAINQAGGGVGLNGVSNILTQNEIQKNANNSQMAEMIANAVAVGAEIGASRGTQNGMVNLSDNRKIMNDAKF